MPTSRRVPCPSWPCAEQGERSEERSDVETVREPVRWLSSRKRALASRPIYELDVIDRRSQDVQTGYAEPQALGSPLAESNETKRRLAAIFAADVEGYSRLMGAD